MTVNVLNTEYRIHSIVAMHFQVYSLYCREASDSLLILYPDYKFIFITLIQAPEEVHVDTPNILDCDEIRQFWVWWDGGTIRVGDGFEVGYSPFMSFVDENPYEVNYVTLSTGWDASGEWRIEEGQGE